MTIVMVVKRQRGRMTTEKTGTITIPKRIPAGATLPKKRIRNGAVAKDAARPVLKRSKTIRQILTGLEASRGFRSEKTTNIPMTAL